MRSVLINGIEVFEKESISLYQGKGANMDIVSQSVSLVTEVIMQLMESLSDEDKLNTSFFLKNVMNDFEMAIRNKDDLMLADCLYYQWREMCIIFEDVLEGDM